MKLVVFGLTVSSSWGNGHATLWRGLIRSLAKRGWRTVFFEHDTPYYAGARDLHDPPGGELVLYADWTEVRTRARAELADCDVAIVTSFCPDGMEASRTVLDSRCVRCFYDLDTPVTLAAIDQDDDKSFVAALGLGGFDLVLSFTGGGALDALRTRLGARQVAPLYGHVDPDVHMPTAPAARFVSDMSYLGTYAADRQATLENIFIEPARRMPDRRFIIGGAQYPPEFPWAPNIYFVRHLPPDQHATFYCSSRLTANVTRRAMADMGWCPSGRLFEAAACGVPILTDDWPGLGEFFSPGEEILVARNAEDTIAALDRSAEELGILGRRARDRVLADHTSDRRAEEFETILCGLGPVSSAIQAQPEEA